MRQCAISTSSNHVEAKTAMAEITVMTAIAVTTTMTAATTKIVAATAKVEVAMDKWADGPVDGLTDLFFFPF